MTLSFKAYKRIWFPAAVTYFAAGYLLCNRLNSYRLNYFDVGYSFEAATPFIPYFIFAYILVYLSMIGLYFLIDEESQFKLAIKSFFALTTLHYLIFILVPVKMTLRPFLPVSDDLINHLVKFFYWLDLPYNCFPSLHVAYAFLSALILWDYKRKWAYVYLLITIVVSVSVVLLKQHYLLDVLAAYISTIFIFRICLGKFKSE